MKHKGRPLFASFATATTTWVICATFSVVLDSHASTIDRLNTTDTLDLPAAWGSKAVSIGRDTARWTSAIDGTGSNVGIAFNLTFGKLLMQSTTAITISGPSLLGLNGVGGVGIDITAATRNVSVSVPSSYTVRPHVGRNVYAPAG